MKRIFTIVLLSLAFLPAFSQFLLSQPNKKDWFIGGQVGPTFAIADNITDHSVFRDFGSALGVGFNVYGGKFFTPKVGCRVGVGYFTTKNRGDNQWISETDFLDKYSSAFYHFGTVEAYGDCLLDFTSMSAYYSKSDHPFHVMGSIGLAMLATGEKHLSTKAGGNGIEKEDLNTMGISEKSCAVFAFRLGIILDYRFSPHLTGNFEINTSMAGDKFDGIDFDEPIDFLFKSALGVTYYF